MIRQLARWYSEQIRLAAINAGQPVPTNRQLLDRSIARVFNLHPLQLLRFFEEAWAYRDGAPDLRPDSEIPAALLYGVVPGLESGIRDDLPLVVSDIFDPPTATYRTVIGANPAVDTGTTAKWDHLIYA